LLQLLARDCEKHASILPSDASAVKKMIIFREDYSALFDVKKHREQMMIGK